MNTDEPTPIRTRTQVETDRQAVSRHVHEYLANGGEIHCYGVTTPVDPYLSDFEKQKRRAVAKRASIASHRARGMS